jgi:hypothetical protein
MLPTKFVKKIETHVLCSITLFENPTVYEIFWENIVESNRLHIKIWRMRITCWIPEATKHTYSQYVMFSCFSTATMVIRKRLNIKLYVKCLGFLINNVVFFSQRG